MTMIIHRARLSTECNRFETKPLLVWLCRVKLASTKRRTRGCSGVDLGLSDPSCGGCELADDVISEAALDVRGLVAGVVVWSAYFEVFLLQSLLPTHVVESLTACPTDSITLNAVSMRLATTFSSKSPTLSNVSWNYLLMRQILKYYLLLC